MTVEHSYIQKLKTELEKLRTCGLCELLACNENAAANFAEWEKQAEKAEAELEWARRCLISCANELEMRSELKI